MGPARGGTPCAVGPCHYTPPCHVVVIGGPWAKGADQLLPSHFGQSGIGTVARQSLLVSVGFAYMPRGYDQARGEGEQQPREKDPEEGPDPASLSPHSALLVTQQSDLLLYNLVPSRDHLPPPSSPGQQSAALLFLEHPKNHVEGTKHRRETSNN